MHFKLIASLVCLGAASPCLLAQGAPSDGPRIISFDRSLSYFNKETSGDEKCAYKSLYFGGRLLTRDEGAERQVDCAIGSDNRAVCVNSFADAPRVDVYDPATDEIIVWEKLLRNRYAYYVFTYPLSKTNGTAVLHVTRREAWPSDVAQDDVKRPDLIPTLCTVTVQMQFKRTTRPPIARPNAPIESPTR